MMTTESIRSTIKVFQDRKLATGKLIGEPGEARSRFTDDAAIRACWVGMDIDYDELADVSSEMAIAAITAIQEGVRIFDAIQGAWADGVATGILHEQRRREMDGKENSRGERA